MNEYAEAIQKIREAGEIGDVEAAAETIEKLKAEINAAFEIFADALALLEKGVAAILESIAALHKEFLQAFPNRRVLHLARYGRGRTRKKNINRIIKWLKKKSGPRFGLNS